MRALVNGYMDLAVHKLNLQFLHLVTLHQSPPAPLTTNRRRQPPHHVRGAAVLSMPLRDLTLRRINKVRFHHPKLFSDKNIVASNNSMADEAKNKIAADSATDHKKEEAEKQPEKPRENIPPPPPPEKPLPDDCCGSGCVRCVWDIYYDELEEYNKLYKTSPDS